MTNMYAFWRLVVDPPSPWNRLTRQNKYSRFSNNTSNHMVVVGSATRTGSPSSVVIGNGTSIVYGVSGMLANVMALHTHSAPASWTISSANNNPLSYGLDIIYMDMDEWESSQKCFPEGTVLVSNGALVESSELARFTAADGRYIVNDSPGTLGGSDTPQSQRCQGNVGSSTPIINIPSGTGATVGVNPNSHNHAIDLYTAAAYLEPRRLVTRLYEALTRTSQAQAGIVVFVDGSVNTNLWEILTSWNGANLKAGNSDPTLSGNDSPTQTISGNTSDHTAPNSKMAMSGTPTVTQTVHSHPVSADLIVSVVPSSITLIPARLLTTLYGGTRAPRATVVGTYL